MLLSNVLKKFSQIAIYFFLLSFVFFQLNCKKDSSNPISGQQGIITIHSWPISATYNTSQDSLKIQAISSITLNHEELPKEGLFCGNFLRWFPEDWPNLVFKKEFITMPANTFEVNIVNCKPDKKLGIVWNSLVPADTNVAIRIDTIKYDDNSFKLKFLFNVKQNGKGYFSFTEHEANNTMTEESVGFIIGYTSNPIEKLWIKIDDIEWTYDTTGSFSELWVRLKGSTNGYRLTGKNIGDGILSSIDIPINKDKSFNYNMPVSFCAAKGIILKESTNLALYGTAGFPKIIQLNNPLQ